MTEKKNKKKKPPEGEGQPPFDDVVSAILQVPKENIKKPERKKKKVKKPDKNS